MNAVEILRRFIGHDSLDRRKFIGHKKNINKSKGKNVNYRK